MIIINYPTPQFRVKREKTVEFIFDALRKKWLVLTPEEWVRQNFTQYLLQELRYPSTLVALEKEIRLGELKKRFDILVYDTTHKPWMIIECKGRDIALTSGTLEQALRYNISVPVPYIIITNGNATHGWHRSEGQLKEIADLPLHN